MNGAEAAAREGAFRKMYERNRCHDKQEAGNHVLTRQTTAIKKAPGMAVP